MSLTTKQLATLAEAEQIIQEQAREYGLELNSPQRSTTLFTTHFAQGDRFREKFVVAYLAASHQLISLETMFVGTLDGAAVYPREIVRKALELGAAAVVLSHNHPSGNTTPSSADKRITERLQAALALLDIQTLDHIIVGDRGNTYSFAENGLL